MKLKDCLQSTLAEAPGPKESKELEGEHNELKEARDEALLVAQVIYFILSQISVLVIVKDSRCTKNGKDCMT